LRLAFPCCASCGQENLVFYRNSLRA
jgi:hypothetical protein